MLPGLHPGLHDQRSIVRIESNHCPCRENDALVEKLQVSAPGSQPLRFHTRYSTGLLFQVHALDALHALLAQLPCLRPQAHALSSMQ